MTTRDLSYWKQADNGLYAHIYEHLMSRRVENEMRLKGYDLIVDYAIWAKTYGTSLFIDIRPYTSMARGAAKQALTRAWHQPLTKAEVTTAAKECAIEYERPLESHDASLLNILNELHAKPWQATASFHAEKADEKSSVNTLFKTADLSYGKQSKKAFTQFYFEFSLSSEKVSDTPAKKALAVLLIQTLALNLAQSLNAHFTVYDRGDQWATGGDIAYRLYFGFLKDDAPDTKKLQAFVNAEQGKFFTSAFLRKLKRLLTITYRNPDYFYFSHDAMNEITDGIVVGPRGWRSVAKQALMTDSANAIITEVFQDK